jgi:DNA-3-methyladenine glycosylase
LNFEPFGPDFYRRDPLIVAPDLLGMMLIRRVDATTVKIARIVETEAYRGEEDLACHAARGRTTRTESLYGPPGLAYIYLIYGMYDMLNAVTWPEGDPSAVLIRAVEPIEGIDRSTDGPGKLTRAMSIDRSLNRVSLDGPELLIAAGEPVERQEVSTGPRIGVGYAGEWAERPWRFWIAGNQHVSR